MSDRSDINVLHGLTANQLKAANTDGPVLVLAGAGTGKTRTLTAAIARRIMVSGIDPTRILAVTFTNKAAKEMADRIQATLGIPTRQRLSPTPLPEAQPSKTPDPFQNTPTPKTRRHYRVTGASHFRFPDPLQKTGSGSGKTIKFRNRNAIKKRDRAHYRAGMAAVLAEPGVLVSRF